MACCARGGVRLRAQCTLCSDDAHFECFTHDANVGSRKICITNSGTSPRQEMQLRRQTPGSKS
eukprot:324698-Pleurochrysis_carterae.AAC.1